MCAIRVGSTLAATAVLTSALLLCNIASAEPAFQSELFARYPNAAGSLPGCIACHDSPPSLNPFGQAFLANGLVLNAALEALDSDGDGFTNGAELAASQPTNPGDPNSRPGVGPPPGPPSPAVSSSNYTGMWWAPAESGWGLTVNHQGSTIFATLYTYSEAGVPMWLVMSAGQLQADGRTFTGDLYRSTGPAFNAAPFTSANLAPVGTMSITFTSSSAASLSYTYGGIAVAKNIVQHVFGTAAASCTTTTGSRAALTNYQDLWWNPSEPGWGINITNQNDTLFAALYTYDLAGANHWMVMSSGLRQVDGSYVGDLFVTNGPAFNATPFAPIGAANLTRVGTMRLAFADGNTGTLDYTVNDVPVSKPITRFVFSSPVPSCSSPRQSTPTSTDGASLYATQCAACHGPLAASGKGGATLARIQGAIAGNVGGMGYLSSLSSAELQAIVSALAPVTATPAACGSCHSIPPGTGVHAKHNSRYPCSSCHGAGYSSTTVNSATHGNGIRELASSAGWNPASRSCANSCHGTAAWSPTATLSCSSCHGNPPGTGVHAKHNASYQCGSCHGAGYSSTTVNAATHRNGIKELLASIGWNATARSCANSCHGTGTWSPTATLSCSSCHGNPPSTGKHGKHQSRSCGTCHGTGYSSSTVNAATHRNGTRDIAATSIGWNATSRSCTNSCHGKKSW